MSRLCRFWHHGWHPFALCCLLVGAHLWTACAEPHAPTSQTGAIVVGDRVIFTLQEGVGSITPVERAGIVNARLERVLTDPKLQPESLEIQIGEGADPILALPGLALLSVSSKDALAEDTSQEELARRWSRLLRDALSEAKPLYRAGHHEGVSFAPLLLVSALAFVVPLLTTRLRRFPMPIVVGEILVGILIGRSGLGLVRYDSWLQFLAEFGFAYLMFLSGLEVDIDLLSRKTRRSIGEDDTEDFAENGNENGDRKSLQNGAQNKPANGADVSPLRLAMQVFLLTLVPAFLIALALTALGLLPQPWLMALVLSTTSLGLVVPILKERGLQLTAFGQTILLSALVADFITMFGITVLAGWLSSGPTLELFLGLGLLAVFVLALRVGHVLRRYPALGHAFSELSHATAQISVRGSLFLMLAFVALSAQLGTEVILGAFLAGVLLALFTKRETSNLHEKLETLGYGFFIPIFFVMVGARFDLSALIGSPQGLLLAPLLILAAIGVKVLAALPFRKLVSPREALATGFLISPGLSLMIAAAEIGKRLGLFPDAVYAALIAVSLVTAIVGPLGFQLLMPRMETLLKATPESV